MTRLVSTSILLQYSASNLSAAIRRRFSLQEWLSNFLEADAAAYRDAVLAEPEDWDHIEDSAGGMPGAADDFFDEDISDGLFESLAIMGLAAALAFLVIIRRRRADERERRERERAGAEGQQQGGGNAGGAAAAPVNAGGGNGGLFPQPGDGDFMDWAVGGVGH